MVVVKHAKLLIISNLCAICIAQQSVIILLLQRELPIRKTDDNTCLSRGYGTHRPPVMILNSKMPADEIQVVTTCSNLCAICIAQQSVIILLLQRELPIRKTDDNTCLSRGYGTHRPPVMILNSKMPADEIQVVTTCSNLCAICIAQQSVIILLLQRELPIRKTDDNTCLSRGYGTHRPPVMILNSKMPADEIQVVTTCSKTI